MRSLPIHSPARQSRRAAKNEKGGEIRLYDRIKSRQYQMLPYDVTFFSPAHWASYEQGIRGDMFGVADAVDTMPAELIVADNIDDFCFRTYPTDREFGLSVKEIPNLVPPFQRFFIDIRPADPYVRKRIREFGALVSACEIPEDAPRRNDFGPDYSPRFMFAWRAIVVIDGVALVTTHHQVVVSDEKGDILSETVVPDETIARQSQPESVSAASLLSAFAGPVLTAVSFMNCGNVRTKIERPESRLSAAHKKRTGEWLSSYRTIEIIPVVRLIRESAQANGGTHAQSAAHIIRGHFKRYEEKPLFGRTKGTFFWSSQARGSLGAGERKHVYSIRTDGNGKI